MGLLFLEACTLGKKKTSQQEHLTCGKSLGVIQEKSHE